MDDLEAPTVPPTPTRLTLRRRAPKPDPHHQFHAQEFLAAPSPSRTSRLFSSVLPSPPNVCSSAPPSRLPGAQRCYLYRVLARQVKDETGTPTDSSRPAKPAPVLQHRVQQPVGRLDEDEREDEVGYVFCCPLDCKAPPSLASSHQTPPFSSTAPNSPSSSSPHSYTHARVTRLLSSSSALTGAHAMADERGNEVGARPHPNLRPIAVHSAPIPAGMSTPRLDYEAPPRLVSSTAPPSALNLSVEGRMPLVG
ncbi:hypothetical protein B0H12DRAFT_1240074 [Mycena haematopus]|nr:hypothetical protein B0H12DRAFT_1240074 [Mycena haematopus]